MPESIGSAFLTVKAKPDESFESDLESAGSKGGKGFGTAFQVAAGNLLADAAKALGSAIADTFTTAFNNYADYEQLVGGVDTLFRDSSEKVQRYAANAFQTAGLSANQYMETVTSFSAAMINSLGGDTDKATEYANRAITDMADNANKMGTSMEEVQRAYQSMARGNFGMLDSLKLGYGGTRAEMERMLADAEKISGVKYDISNFADITEAIHVMQEQMGIAGATAEEAEKTISGSLSMLSASWQNLLTGIFDSNADLAQLVENLFHSLGAVASNVFPAFASLIANLFSQLPGIINDSLNAIPSVVGPTLDEVFGEEIGGKVTEAIGGVMSFITDVVGPTVQWAMDLIIPIVQQIAEAIFEVMPSIMSVVTTVMDAIKAVVEAVWPVIQGIITGAIAVIKGAIEGLATAVGVVTSVFNAIKTAIETPINAARDIVRNAIEAIKGFFSFKFEWPHIPLPHFSISGSINPLDWLTQGPPHLSVDWYAKGGIVDSPTLIGAGEAGPEAIVPLTSPNIAPFADAVAARLNAAGDTFIFNVTADSETTLQRLVQEAQRARLQYA